MEFLVKNKTLAMTSEMHLALISLARNYCQSYQSFMRKLQCVNGV